MKKKTLTFISPKDKKILYIGAIIFTIALALFSINKVLAYQDGRRFAEISRDKDTVVGQLVRYLGDSVASSKKQDVCFNTEQGPYDNGRLWCQVGTIINLKSDMSQEELGNRFLQSAKDEGFVAQSSNNLGVSRFWFKAGGISCILSTIASNGDEITGAASKPFTKSDAPALAITCADRAKAKHYPYVD